VGWPGRTDVAVRTYIYIACRGHSGSTLLEKLLATSPEVTALGEICHFSHYFDSGEHSCGCGQAVRDCEFWSAVVRELGLSHEADLDAQLPTDGYRRNESWRNLPYHLALLGPDAALRVAERGRYGLAVRNLQSATNHWRLVDAVSRVADTRVLIDKSMSASRLLEVARVAPRDVRICAIHLIRDGRANVHSHLVQFGTTVEHGAAEWRRNNVNIQRAFRRAATLARMTIRYEDLCAQPAETLAEIARRFELGVTFEPSQLQATNHAIGGNQAKLTGYASIALDERWRTALTPAQREVFERVAGSLNRRYGYA
jgi:hypothetical protein